MQNFILINIGKKEGVRTVNRYYTYTQIHSFFCWKLVKRDFQMILSSNANAQFLSLCNPQTLSALRAYVTLPRITQKILVPDLFH